MAKRKSELAAEQATLQRAHDKLAAELDRVTGKPLGELTRAEYDWLIHRFWIPQGESPQASQRRQYVNRLVGDEQHDQWKAAREQAEQTGKLHIVTAEQYEGAVFARIQAGQHDWPAEVSG